MAPVFGLVNSRYGIAFAEASAINVSEANPSTTTLIIIELEESNSFLFYAGFNMVEQIYYILTKMKFSYANISAVKDSGQIMVEKWR